MLLLTIHAQPEFLEQPDDPARHVDPDVPLHDWLDSAAHSPALPSGHPFADVQDIYWSSTTSLFKPDWAWVLYLEKGAPGVGQKRFA
ncbi:MAG: Lcl C-terminal domain-containing protein [Sulfuricella sp.]